MERRLPGAARGAAVLTLADALGGCSGAPSYVFFGAYFPAWMLFSLIGILAAIVVRILLVKTGLAETLPYQLFLCVAAGTIVASVIWLASFGG
jgi:YtcA family